MMPMPMPMATTTPTTESHPPESKINPTSMLRSPSPPLPPPPLPLPPPPPGPPPPAAQPLNINDKKPPVHSDGFPKPIKRRAAKACAACRARKVRCDVMQKYHMDSNGDYTCSNCTMDGIRCVIEESKRRKKHLDGQAPQPYPYPYPHPHPQPPRAWPNANGIVNPLEIEYPEDRRWSSSSAHSLPEATTHIPHGLYQGVNNRIENSTMLRRQGYMNTQQQYEALLTSASMSAGSTETRLATPPLLLAHQVPAYLKPLPQRMPSVDIDYLFAKGALSIPVTPARNALLRAYCEFVHPYMPVLELHHTLDIINHPTGESGKISLLLFQAIMFAGAAFVDMNQLVAAGYTNRKAARKALFQKARVLYDFDYEIDRVALIQSLLLMTYWYETPDDQKDTWHWMGVAISLAHTIGLHRDPENSTMEPAKKKLWKRIWWSCFMRDRLIALGMRRPTRVKDEDYDVPMLVEEDFEIATLSEEIPIIPTDCTLMRSTDVQRELALMCIAKAKLCLCIGHVLSAQYSVLVRQQGMQGQEGSTRSSVMLFPKKLDQTDQVTRCDEELQEWVRNLPPACHYSETVTPGNAGETLFVQRSLLHMVYYTTLSALHRPQVLPCAGVGGAPADSYRELQDLSRKQVREASREITKISKNIHEHCLEKYLPTTGVTVLLPAIIIHLLDIKSCNDEARRAAMNGFCQCMQVLEKLRDSYASADFATQFLEAAIRKADIEMVMSSSTARGQIRNEDVQNTLASRQVQEVRERAKMASCLSPPHKVESNSDVDGMDSSFSGATEIQAQHSQAAISAHPASVFSPANQNNSYMHNLPNINPTGEYGPMDTNVDLNDFLVLDAGWNVPLDEGAHGESSGFIGDMSWVDHGPGWGGMHSHSPLPGEEFFREKAAGAG